MSMRSTTPSSSCSAPSGISVATTWGPNAALRESSARKKSARSRSSMFTNSTRARPSSSARCHRRSVETSAPITPLTTKTAPSQTRSAARASATKLGSPGVSIRLILRSCQRKELRLAEIDIWRAFSSGAESETVVPSTTEPSRFTCPASKSIASKADVFPLPRWPTKATLRILFGLSCAIQLLPSAALRPQATPGRVELFGRCRVPSRACRAAGPRDWPHPRSRPRVGARIGQLEPPRLHPRVGLGRGQRGVAEQLLDGPQVGPALEQVGGERVPQRVRGHPAGEGDAAHGLPEAAAYVGGGQPPPTPREEQRGLGARAVAGGGQRRPAPLEVCGESPPRGLTRRHDPRLPALALDPHLLAVGVDARDVEVHELLGAEPRRVAELEHRAVSQLERGRDGDALEQRRHLSRLEHPRQVGAPLGGRDQVRRIGLDLAALQQQPVEGPDGRELARHRRPGGAALGDHAGEAAQFAGPYLERAEPAGRRPLA